MSPVIETQRLRLRGPAGADFSVYERFYTDAEASAVYGGPMTTRQAWRTLAADIGHWQLRGYGMWSVVLRATGQMVGACGLYWPEGWPRPELTWWIVPEARRNGYAFEASRAVIDHGYGALGWSQVETHMNDANIAASSLALKLGGKMIAREMFPDGIERNVYALPPGDA